MKVKLNLGDWSQDGHNLTKVVILEVNKTVKEIQDAYRKSCKDSGVELHELCSEYNDDVIDRETIEKLNNFGIDTLSWVYDSYEVDNNDDVYFNILGFRDLILDFIKVSLPDLTYEIVKDDIPSINGFWGDLNVSFGYGLFRD